MSKKIEHIIDSLVHDDFDTFKKLKKSELLQVVKLLQTDLYRECDDLSLEEMYTERFAYAFQGVN
jgi:hypothetical protein